MKGYCTKYALSQGIFEVEIRPIVREPYVYTVRNEYGSSMQLILNKNFFTDRAAAEENARQQAVRKITSIKKQLSALEKLKREPKWRGA